MSTTLPIQTSTSADQSSAVRLASIDVFRGLTMAVMIFVNELSGVRGLPWWTYHAPARADVMTYVDMVFPFFLFAVGLSLPLAIETRLKRNGSIAGLWAHVLVRSVSLIVLGLILANAEKAEPARMGISGNLWGLLSLIFASLFLLDFRKLERIRPYSRVLQILGVLGVAVLYAIFRRTTHAGHAAWIDFSYPEILGLIGFSYFSVALLYIPTRRWNWAPAAWFAVLVSLCALTTARMFVFPIRLPLYVWPFGNGAMSCIVMAGVVVSLMFRRAGNRAHPLPAILAATAFAVITLGAGWALAPLGISKIRATPTWCLWSIGAASLLFALLYWICDVNQWQRWALPVKSAGSNTLLTYLLPDLWYFVLGSLGIVLLEHHFTSGWPGIARTTVFTALILALSAMFTRLKLRLQL